MLSYIFQFRPTEGDRWVRIPCLNDRHALDVGSRFAEYWAVRVFDGDRLVGEIAQRGEPQRI